MPKIQTNLESTTFNIDDWLAHTPKAIIAKNFGVNVSVFDNLPATNPYILNSTVSSQKVSGAPGGELTGDASFVYRTLQHSAEKVPGGAGEFRKIDSTNFPASKTIAATFVHLKPGGLRELHWHPNVCTNLPIVNRSSFRYKAEEWLYFHQGKGRATIFIGNSNARTFDFSAGDTAAFPDNSG